MAGAHDDRESVAGRLGLTPMQRDQLIWTWHHQGYSLSQIAKQVGMSKQGVSYALGRIAGKPRVQTSYDVCDECGGTFPQDEVVDGLCGECESHDD